jgi:pSer/pThr/pTyr-binding forkhead associated (FHA) protein
MECSSPGNIVTSKELTSKKTTIPVAEGTGRISHPDHIAQLVRIYANIIVFQVLGNEQPLLVKDPTKITIGRFSAGETAPTIDLVPYNANLLGVSRLHAVINRTEKGYAIEDQASTNGTWLNEIKLTPHQPYELRNGDLIRFGQLAVYVYFRTGDSAPLVSEETIRLKTGLADQPFVLTPLNLEGHIVPYLNALMGIQAICDQVTEQPEADVILNGVAYDLEKSVVEIRVTGAQQAMKLIREKIAPWRESNKAKISYVASRVGAESQPESAGPTEQLRKEMLEAEMTLASQLLSDLAPQRSEDERKAYLEKLLPHLHALNLVPLQIESI